MTNFVEAFADETAYSAFTGSSEFLTPNVSVCSGGSNSIFYNPYEYNPANDYFTTVAKSNGTISFSGSSTANTLRYSKDNGTTWSTAAQITSVTVDVGDKVLWKGECKPIYNYGIGNFRNGTATFDVEGNVMSLLFGDNFKGQTSLTGKDSAFHALFTVNTKVISAENLSLPATVLAESCYSYMFSGCTSLVNVPSSIGDSTTTMVESACKYMFVGCTSLTTSPALPATAMSKNCYAGMFSGCTSLTTAPSVLPAETLAQYCYQGMFIDCTGLTTAPALPATALVENCYQYMFYGCTGLNNITCLATDISAYNCTGSWVYGVPSGGTFKKAASMTSWTTGISGIPSGWSVQTS